MSEPRKIRLGICFTLQSIPIKQNTGGRVQIDLYAFFHKKVKLYKPFFPRVRYSEFLEHNHLRKSSHFP